MRSSWSITYSGPHYCVVLKKFGRVGKFEPLEIEYERLLIADEKVVHASFLVNLKSEDWPGAVVEILNTARFVFPEWRVMPGKGGIKGSFGDLIRGYTPGYKLLVSGLRSVEWELNELQDYSRQKWLSGQPNQW